MKPTPEDRFKFRVYSSRLKRYIEQSPCIGLTGMVMDIHTLEKNHVIEQCIGLIDKHGNLIFEGDIVRFDNDNQEYVITWHCGLAQFDAMSFSDISIKQRQLSRCEHNFIEIIGNVHDKEESNKDV